MNKSKPKIVLIVHDIRSAHNAGSLLRSADGFGVERVYFTGYTPYPQHQNDERLPHLSAKIDRQIHKTALGAEKTVPWTHASDILEIINELKQKGFLLVALEQTPKAKNLNNFKLTQDTALIVGSEVDGVDKKTLKQADVHLQIPMRGSKESFNVAVAGSIALYQLQTTA